MWTGTVEEVQELRAQLEEEAEVSAQAYDRVQRAESELAQLRADYTALQVSLNPHLASPEIAKIPFCWGMLFVREGLPLLHVLLSTKMHCARGHMSW